MKKVIIIGATSGIGRELARLYLQAGWAVGITGRRVELLDSFRNEHSSHKIDTAVKDPIVETECFDVRENKNVEHLKNLINKLEGLDLLVYNSGYGEVSKSLDWEIDKRIYETNVKGFIEIVNYTFNHFIKQGYGQIAATSSIASVRGNSQAPAYSASKAFMSVYMEGLHIKAKKMKANIAITDIQPGFVQTKEIKLTGVFWVVPLKKAARQIFKAIEKKKWRVYISRRWWLIPKLLNFVPSFIYHRFG